MLPGVAGEAEIEIAGRACDAEGSDVDTFERRNISLKRIQDLGDRAFVFGKT